jgi:CPA2 family monovalent cation:H+ antiporter-2/glutathione-regulated potassium-efflux system protein KefB
MMLAAPLRREAIRREERDGPKVDGANALIVGYGRFGQTVGQMLIAQGIPVTLIDTDIEMIDIASEFGAKVYYGDGTRLDLLRQAGAADAELILFCLDGDQITPDIVEGVKSAFPKAGIFVRAFDRRALIKLKEAPVDGVVREVLESAVKMARLAMTSLDIPEEEIERSEQHYRNRDKERLKVQFETGDMRAAGARMIVQDRREMLAPEGK